MSFKELKVGELREVAEFFGVNVEKDSNKGEILALLDEDGVDFKEQYEGIFVPAKEAFEKKVEEDKKRSSENATKDDPDVKTLLIKMTRKNPSFSIKGYKWTKRHPFQVVKQDDAEYIVRNFKGFSIALPSEAESYYA